MIVSDCCNKVSFGYSSPLKTLFKKGKLPTVTKGFYGGTLTKDTVSLEHLIPHSQGGRTELSNLVLATKENNNLRSNLPIKDFINIEQVKIYLKQFQGVLTDNLNGDKYIKNIIRTLRKMGVEI